MHGTRLSLLATLALAVMPSPFGLAAPLQDIPQAQQPTFSVNASVVNVFVTVRDRKGNLIKDLNQEDFTLFENGRQQPIQYFSRETDLPLTIGLIIDASPSESNALEEEKESSQISA
jgi:hypothetical protein